MPRKQYRVSLDVDGYPPIVEEVGSLSVAVKRLGDWLGDFDRPTVCTPFRDIEDWMLADEAMMVAYDTDRQGNMFSSLWIELCV
jgi:hypothetical protein